MEPAASTLINSLIQESYNFGYNDFIFEMGDSRVDMFAKNLKGSKSNRMKLTIYGSVGNFIGDNSSYIDLSVQGPIGDFSFKKIDNCSVKIYSDAGSHCASDAKHSYLEIGGTLDTTFASRAYGCTFKINQSVSYPRIINSKTGYPSYCTFLTSDERTYKSLNRNFGLQKYLHLNSVRLIK